MCGEIEPKGFPLVKRLESVAPENPRRNDAPEAILVDLVVSIWITSSVSLMIVWLGLTYEVFKIRIAAPVSFFDSPLCFHFLLPHLIVPQAVCPRVATTTTGVP